MASFDGKSDLASYAHAPEKRESLYKRSLIIVVISQIFSGAGLAAGITVGALLAQKMLGDNSLAGMPVALFTLGSAGAAYLVGKFSERYGRRFGLAGGYLVGAAGAVGVIAAAITNSAVLLFISLIIYGSGMATNLQARYAGTDLANKKQRATAVSMAMVSTTFGAVAGPNLVEPMGRFALKVGLPALAGPFLLAAAAYALAGLVLLIFLHPDPLIVSKLIARSAEGSAELQGEQAEVLENRKGIIAGAAVMVLTQMIMLAIMTMTPVHMAHHGHGLRAVGLVIGIHIGCMYFPSLFTGILADKFGRITMAVASGITLLTAGLLAAFAPTHSLGALIAALALLGLGWNFGLISGTALIVDSTGSKTRAKTQGTVDVLIALAGASGGALSGMVVAGASFATLSIGGGIFALVLIPIVFWSRTSKADSRKAA